MQSLTYTRVVLCLWALLAASACGKKSARFPICSQDSDCGSGEVCFADGCGNPQQGIRVEVTPNTQEGLYAQDFALDEVKGRVNFEITAPTLIQGQVPQGAPAPAGQAYGGLISLRANGESVLIPGLMRIFESRIRPVNGAYAVPVGAGAYSVLVTPLEDNLPPIAVPSRTTVPTGGAASADFVFPLPEALRVFAGSLVMTESPLRLINADMDVQALDTNMRPLSQRVHVSRDSGAFALSLSPTVTQFLLQASPRDAAALIPRKLFSVTLVPPPQQTTFELGNYGSSVSILGFALSSQGAPIAGASVYLDGYVGGGGTLRTSSVVTNSAGVFALSTLRSAADTRFRLSIVPPAQSNAGILNTLIAVSGPGLIGPFACPDRIVVQGVIHRPDDSPAVGVRVNAEPVAVVGNMPLPASGIRTSSDGSGAFSLRLDPALYRLDFIPAEQLPRTSRYIAVESSDIDSLVITFSNGRRLTGALVSRVNQSNSPMAVALGSIRFFRVATLDDVQSPVLIAETVSDESGNYTVILPVR